MESRGIVVRQSQAKKTFRDGAVLDWERGAAVGGCVSSGADLTEAPIGTSVLTPSLVKGSASLQLAMGAVAAALFTDRTPSATRVAMEASRTSRTILTLAGAVIAGVRSSPQQVAILRNPGIDRSRQEHRSREA